MSAYNNTISQNYVEYNNKEEVEDLDRNVWKTSPQAIADGASGRHLYKNEPRHSAPYLCFSGRDPESHYIIGVDRDEHPDHSSRFSYGHCPNGYCTGHWPGRYATSLACSKNIMPPGMAPPRFYSDELSGIFAVKSQGIEDYKYAMNLK